MEHNENGLDVVVADVVADVASDVATVATAKPARTRRTVATVARRPVRVRTIADAIAVARHVTPANVDAMVTRYNTNHGVSHAARNVGRLSGGRIMDVQNDFMADNHGLNDLQIAFVFRVDFPAASGKIFTDAMPVAVSIVRGIRADYNRTGHGSKSDTWRTVKSVATGPTRFDFPKPASAVKSA